MSTFASNQVSVNGTATLIFQVTQNATIPYTINNIGNETAYLGTSSVTDTTGYALGVGESITQNFYGDTSTTKLYAVTSGGSTVISYIAGD